MLLLRLPGSFLLRFETRRFRGLLFQEPPRSGLTLFPRLSMQRFRLGGGPPKNFAAAAPLEKEEGEKGKG